MSYRRSSHGFGYYHPYIDRREVVITQATIATPTNTILDPISLRLSSWVGFDAVGSSSSTVALPYRSVSYSGKLDGKDGKLDVLVDSVELF